MASKALSKDDLAFGRVVLLATDVLGLSAEGAFWIRFSRRAEWKFFLVTSLMHTLGPREIYIRLNESLKKQLSDRETKDFNIYIADPGEAVVKKVREYISTERFASDPLKASFKFDDRQADIFVYRMSSDLSPIETRAAKRRFVKISEAVAA